MHGRTCAKVDDAAAAPQHPPSAAPLSTVSSPRVAPEQPVDWLVTDTETFERGA